jgi:hypothetical protein
VSRSRAGPSIAPGSQRSRSADPVGAAARVDSRADRLAARLPRPVLLRSHRERPRDGRAAKKADKKHDELAPPH